MFCIRHVTSGYMFKYQGKWNIFDWWKVPPRHLQTRAILRGTLQNVFQHCAQETCVKFVWLYLCTCDNLTSTHAVNVSARLLWMDFTGCSIIHNSQHQLHERHEQHLPNSWNLYISVDAFQLHAILCSLASTVDVYRRVCHTWMTSDM